MKRTDRLGIYIPLLIAFTLASITTRTVALFTDFDVTSGFFDGKLIISISNVIAFVGVLGLLSFAFVSKKISLVPSFSSPATYLPSGIVCAALVFLSVESLFFLSSKNGGLFGKSVLSNLSNLILLVSALLAIAAVINFFLCTFFTERVNEKRAAFGILTVLFLAAYAVYLYFDVKLPINSPNKATDQLAILISACFFLFETRISLGIEKWRGYVAFGLSASLLLAYSSIPTLIYYFVKGEMISDSLSSAVLCFTLFIYVCSRVVLVNRLLDDKKSEGANWVEEMVKIREQELSLPSQTRIESKEESFATMGENYEINLHLGTISDAKHIDQENEENEKSSDE